ncbi:hypothetical protein P9112_004565 [Eukaryota sp. TZLM1-RC]
MKITQKIQTANEQLLVPSMTWVNPFHPSPSVPLEPRNEVIESFAAPFSEPTRSSCSSKKKITPTVHTLDVDPIDSDTSGDEPMVGPNTPSIPHTMPSSSLLSTAPTPRTPSSTSRKSRRPQTVGPLVRSLYSLRRSQADMVRLNDAALGSQNLPDPMVFQVITTQNKYNIFIALAANEGTCFELIIPKSHLKSVTLTNDTVFKCHPPWIELCDLNSCQNPVIVVQGRIELVSE